MHPRFGLCFSRSYKESNPRHQQRKGSGSNVRWGEVSNHPPPTLFFRTSALLMPSIFADLSQWRLQAAACPISMELWSGQVKRLPFLFNIFAGPSIFELECMPLHLSIHRRRWDSHLRLVSTLTCHEDPLSPDPFWETWLRRKKGCVHKVLTSTSLFGDTCCSVSGNANFRVRTSPRLFGRLDNNNNKTTIDWIVTMQLTRASDTGCRAGPCMLEDPCPSDEIDDDRLHFCPWRRFPDEI